LKPFLVCKQQPQSSKQGNRQVHTANATAHGYFNKAMINTNHMNFLGLSSTNTNSNNQRKGHEDAMQFNMKNSKK